MRFSLSRSSDVHDELAEQRAHVEGLFAESLPGADHLKSDGSIRYFNYEVTRAGELARTALEQGGVLGRVAAVDMVSVFDTTRVHPSDEDVPVRVVGYVLGQCDGSTVLARVTQGTYFGSEVVFSPATLAPPTDGEVVDRVEFDGVELRQHRDTPWFASPMASELSATVSPSTLPLGMTPRSLQRRAERIAAEVTSVFDMASELSGAADEPRTN